MRRFRFAAVAVFGALVALSCTDARNSVLPTDPSSTADISIRQNLRQCLTPAAIDELAKLVWGRRHPNYFGVVGHLSPILSAMQRNDTAKARVKAFAAVDYIMKLQGRRRFRGNPPAVDAIIQAIFCLAAIKYVDPANSFLIMPTDQPQVVVSGDAQAGVQLPANPVSEPTLLTVVPIVNSFPPGGGPLLTKLDQYPGFYEFLQQSPTNAPLLQPVIVAVCPSITVPDSIRSRLRLGHQASFGFEVTPPAPANFLNCPPSIALNTTSSSFLAMLKGLVMPKELHAASRFGTGGVGGSAGEFSPFAPVDPVLSFGGGVGGSAGEFWQAPIAKPTSGGTVQVAPGATRQLQVAPGGSKPKNAFVIDCSIIGVSMAVSQNCRPLVTLTTLLGTPFINVPVTWTVTGGGGSIAPQNYSTLACGPFASTLVSLTGTFGKTGVCWTSGPLEAVNTVVATPGLGGDAINGVSFFPTTITFSVATP